MVYKVYPLLNDFENLSSLKVDSSDHANNFDYSKVVVNKPWGYEYLWFQNEKVAIWFLFIDEAQKTSFHCHVKKRTSLIVLDGKIKCSTIDDRYEMNLLESLVIEPCTFHSSMSIHGQGTIIMEIETPPLKGDLVRMHDNYGRQKSGYENANEYSTDFEKFDFYPLTKEKYSNWKYRNIEIIKSTVIPIFSNDVVLIVPVLGNIISENKVIYEVGESILFTKDISQLMIDNENEYLIFKKLN